MANPDKITVKSASEIQETLRERGFGETGDGRFAYSLLDGTVAVAAAFAGDELSSMDAVFNLYAVPVKTVSGALREAHGVLAPYLTPPEINALCAILAWEIPGQTSSDAIRYQRTIGAYTVSVNGSLITGDASVGVTKNSGRDFDA
ncbi:MAG: hypothetical protein LBR72_01280 [Oscillospiraceae bacterium]|nr:hypothetical protein [Oscillospiraceae bacterium]